MEPESAVPADVPVCRRRIFKDSEKRALIARQASSGKSVVRFCRDEGIVQSSFWRWVKKFSEKTKKPKKPVFVEVPVTMPSVAVEVVLVSGDRVATSSDCDPLWLAKLIRSVGTPPC